MTYQTDETPRPPSSPDGPRPTSPETRGGNTATWVIAGLVAVVAIIAVAFMVASSNRTDGVTQDDLNRVAEQSRMQGVVEGAQSTNNSAMTQAQIAADRAAADARAAAQETRNAAEQARIESQRALDRAAQPPPPPADTAPPQ